MDYAAKRAELEKARETIREQATAQLNAIAGQLALLDELEKEPKEGPKKVNRIGA